MLKPPEQSPPSPDECELRRRRIQITRQIIGIVVAAGVILFFLQHTSLNEHRWFGHVPPLGRTEYDCLYLFGSLFLVYLVLLDIRSGVSRFGRITMFAYTRSSDPVGYNGSVGRLD